jgi:hydroxymethylpyrimidine/phosphomethylpyrimidine kinase
MDKAPPRVLTIAGSDSSGGAGIQADIKTITMLGGYAMSAITALTAQNTVGVQQVEPVPRAMVRAQIASCLDDIGVDAIKIGMVGGADAVAAVAAALEDAPDVPVVLDPVMIATSGGRLADDATIAAMRARLFPLATLLTPNLPELQALTAAVIGDVESMGDAAAGLAREYGCAVLAKGGHFEDARVVDVLVPPEGRMVAYDHARIATRHTHGSGCTLSAAVATFLGHGMPLEHAVKLAREFVFRAIEAAPGFGLGSGPMGHHAVRNG